MYYIRNIVTIFGKYQFFGWGRKRTGRFASWCHNRFGGTLILLEDGFIRSLGLGIEGSPSFSIVEDDVGIYYDATAPSRLENSLNTYDFTSDEMLMRTAREAIELIRIHRLSKYNNAPDVSEGYFGDDCERVLIVAQTAGDASLRYGMANQFSTDEMIDAAIHENPGAEIWLKIHPDVLSGKKSSDIDIEQARQKCKIIEENFNPISLLEHFQSVYTKTSQMGFEALLMGKKCVCFGMPFYAGWGISDDRVMCERRTRRLSVQEVFAAAYILYTRYYNPYKNCPSDILDTIGEIIRQRRMQRNRSNSDTKKKVLAIGDSHIRVFEHHYFKRMFPNTEYTIVYVPGASASGIRNVNSLSQAYSIFRSALEEGGYDEIIVTLGEVDAAYAIWKRAETHNVSVNSIVEDVIEKYQEFILSLQGYAPTTVLSTPFQTISDCRGCSDETSTVRAGIDIPIRNRTELSVEFNRRIKLFCHENSVNYLDLDSWSLGKDGIVRSWLIHPNNPCDHHYYRWRYAMMIIIKMLIRKVGI
ncbi:hypothetical protein [Sulfuricurvum sp.]|uniref:capsular polysaccharide export protein, LipB/KpsS family n=1 Tax=Sulfuricurvum sp. TaxID=2025608 RepID=UPI002E380DD9|nr:hypothetical protein [Sulfuricurvum sp.]HEX5330355.1 hypothetical protein [Sulfuricurvum sp.]